MGAGAAIRRLTLWPGTTSHQPIAEAMVKRVLTLSAILLMSINRPVWADDRGNIMAAFGRCGVFADDRTWLNCIYGAVQPVRGKLGLPPAPDSQINLVPSESLMPQGSSPPTSVRRPISKRSAIDSYLFGGEPIVTDVPMESYTLDQSGLFTITLKNGQVWRELEGSPTPQWRDPASHFLASISKGAFNSY